MNKFKKIKYKQGFTLIETFVAITVLAIVVIGPLRLLSKAIADGNFAKQQITAYYLAQEGTELVVSKRDENIFQINNSQISDWLQGLDCDSGCKIQADVNSRNDISALPCDNPRGPCAQLKQDGSGIYSHDNGEVFTPFFRTVKITPITDDAGIETGAKVEVTVEWRNKGNFVPAPVQITSFIANHSL